MPTDGEPFAVLEVASGALLTSGEGDGILCSESGGHWERVQWAEQR